MANQLYATFKPALLRAFLLGEGFANPVTVKVALIGDAYEFDTNHRTVEDLSDIIETPVEIPGITVSDLAVVDGADLIPAYTELVETTGVAALVLFAEDSVTFENQLIGFMDTAIEGSIPFVVALPDLNIRWPSGGIFGI